MPAKKPVCMATLVLLLSVAGLLPGAARSELRVDVTPAAVTAPDRALVILEASSLHWAAHLLYEDSVEQRTVHVRYAAGLRDGYAQGALFEARLDVSGEGSGGYLTDKSQSLLRIARGVRLRDYRLSEDAADQFPTPAVQYTVRMRTKDARALRLMWEAHEATWGSEFSVDGYNALGRVVLSEALRHTRIRQIASNQVLPWESVGVFDTISARPEELEGIPGLTEAPQVPVHHIDGARHATPLAFLYAAMLAGERSYDEARTADGVAGAAGLSGCRLPDRFSVSQSALDATDPDQLSAAIAGGLDRGGASAPYLILMKRAQRLDQDARTLLAFALNRVLSGGPNLSEAAAAVLAGDVLLDGKAILDQMLWENPEVVEAFVLGHIDPATIPVWRCMALRAARGVVEPSRFAAARNVGYAEFDAMLGARSWRAMLRGGPAEIPDAPRFFAAAHNVTRFFGVGLVDAIELYGTPEAYLDTFAPLAFDASCTGWGTSLPPLIPAAGERQFLRDVNFDLYRNINVPVVGELMRTGVLFDPTSWGPLPHGTPEGAAMAFDLRMVLAEQGRIEDWITEALAEGRYGFDDPAVWERMSNSQIALYCSRLADIARFANSDPEAQFQVIGGLKAMLDALVRNGVVAEESGFRSYLWRVATGSAYVHLLHGATEEAFVAYIRQLKAEMAAVRNAPRSLTPGVQQELTALVERRHDGDAESVRRWTEALATYLHPTDEALRLFGCDAALIPFDLSVTNLSGPLLPRAERIDALAGTGAPPGAAMEGLGPVAIAFDLSASGDGALLPNARIAGAAEDAVAACQAIGSRHQALEGMMTVIGSTMAFLDMATVDRVLVLDRSVKLAETQGQIEPFLLADLRARKDVPHDPEAWTRDDMRALVERAFADAAVYQRNVAIARRLARLPADQFTALDLAMPQVEVERLGVRAALAMTPDAALTKGDAGRAIEAADTLDARIARVTELRTALAGLRTDLCRALDACSGAGGAREEADEGPRRPIPVTYPYPRLTPEEVARGLGSSANLPPGSGLTPDPGVLAGSGLHYRVTPTGTYDAEGRPLEEAELVYRLPQSVGAMVADVEVPEARETIVDTPAMEGLSALTQVREIPLGITFTRTYLDAATGLREMAGGADFSLRRSAKAMNAAARALGLAEWIEIKGLHARAAPGAEEGIAGLRNITVYLDIALLGVNVPERIELPLIRDGVFVDPGQALRAALAARIEAAAAEYLGKIVADLGPMRFPADPEQFAVAPVRFGPSGGQAVDVRFDWDSGSLAAGIDYRLVVGETSVRALVDLLVGPDGGIAIRNARFEEPRDLLPALRAVEALSPVIDTVEGIAGSLAGARAEAESHAATLQAMPVLTGHAASILLRQSLSVALAGQDCVLTFQARLPLDLSGAEEVFTAAVERALDDGLGRCATEVSTTKLFDSLAALEANPSIDVFGTKGTVGFGEDGALSLGSATAMLAASGRLPVELHIDQSTSGCRLPSEEWVRGGALVREGERLRLDVRSLPPEEADKLARAMACAVESFLPEAIRSYVEIDAIDVFGGAVLIDATVRGVPFLSDVPLRRINLTDPTADSNAIAGVVEEFAVEALGIGLKAGLREVFGDDLIIDLAGIGRYAVTSTRVDRARARWFIALEGTLSIESFSFPETTVRIPVGGSMSDIDVRMPDAADLLGKAVADAAVALLPIAPEAPRIENPFFGPLDARGTLYGLRFDMTAAFPLGDNSIEVKIRQASLSLEGIRLGSEITAALPLPLYFGPVALSKVLLTFVTGEEDGTRPGLKLGADLTAVEPEFARVLKLRSVLNLTEIDRLAFTLTSDVIALDTLTLMAAEGRLDLSNSYASFEASASGVVADIIDPRMSGRLDGKEGLVYARSALDVFGERITENELELCSEDCETNGTPGEARIKVAQNLLLGDANGGARTDLRLRDPRLEAGVDLNLFGWKPGGADFGVDLGGAELNMRFLGINVTILTPSYQTMDPTFVARVLKDLLKIDLSDLLDIDPTDITVSLMSSSGDVSSSSQSAGSGSDGAQQANQTGAPGGAPEEEDVQSGPPRSDQVVPPQETWGTAVVARVCERFAGPPGAGEFPPNPDHLYYIYGAQKDDTDPAWLWRPYPFELPDWYSWPTLGGIAAQQLCSEKRPIGGGYRWEVHPEVVSVGAARQVLWQRTTCNIDGSPSVTVRPLDAGSEDPDVRAQFRNAGLPLLCIDTPQGDRLRVESHLYVDRRSAEVMLVPFCPPRTRGYSPEGPLGDVFDTLCRTEGAGVERFALAESGFDFDETVKVITARDELRFYEQVVYPRILGTGVPAERGTPWASYDGSFVATPDEIARGGEVARVTFLIERTGEDGELGTARLDRRNADGTPNLLFDLYLRAKTDTASALWRPLFLELFGRFVRTGEEPDFVTTEIAAAQRIAVRAPELDVPHAQAILWLWFDDTGLKQRLSYLPTTLPTLDGSRGYGRGDMTTLAHQHFEPRIAQEGEGPPLRVEFGIAPEKERQQIVLFADPACTPTENNAPGPCPQKVGHATDDAVYRVTLISHRDERANLSNWTTASGRSASGCIARGDLADVLSQIMGRASTADDIDDLFFDLAKLTGRMPDFTAEPERALAQIGPCP